MQQIKGTEKRFKRLFASSLFDIANSFFISYENNVIISNGDCIQMKIGTVFSGIGAIEQALILRKTNFDILFACDNGERELPYTFEEIKHKLNSQSYEQLQDGLAFLYESESGENKMKTSYLANYAINKDGWHEDIRFLDGKRYSNQLDLFVGGSPCQSFSNMGKRGGLEDARGTLFYDYARLISEIKPKAFIYENVPGMLNHDKGETWEVIKNIFSSLGYKIKWKILNAKDYGIPQSRKRLFVVGVLDKTKTFVFPEPIELQKTTVDYLEEKVAAKYYLGKKGFEFIVSHPGRAQINRTIIRTEKANQQFNWNGDFVFEQLDKKKHSTEILNRAYIGDWKGKKGVIRQLTPRECLRLMGFPDTYKIAVSDHIAYRQAGNSIVVNVLSRIIDQLYACGVFTNED